MASVAWHFFNQYRAEGRVKLFEGSGGYAAGEQKRDFVSIEDVVRVNLDILDHPQRSGVFNLGTGRAATFNEVAVATINACRAAGGEPALALPELVAAGTITYVPFRPRSWASTRATPRPTSDGCGRPAIAPRCLGVEEGVGRYVAALLAGTSVNA